MSTFFSKIISGEIPSFKIYEDEFIFAFLDIFPAQPGHTLIIPKTEVDYFVDVPEPYYSAVFQAAKQIAPALKEATGCKRVCMVTKGYLVPHFHLHLVPTNSESDIDSKEPIRASDESLEAMQTKILAYFS
jgi:histidine triad (HIT) family protein